jgi:hypothetical protein
MLRFHPEEIYTSGRLEAIRALAKIGPAAKDAIPLLEELAEHKHDSTGMLPPYADEARKAVGALKDQ